MTGANWILVGLIVMVVLEAFAVLDLWLTDSYLRRHNGKEES